MSTKKTIAKKPTKPHAGLPDPDESGSDWSPFLKATDVGKVGATGWVVFSGENGRATKSMYGDQVIFPVKFNKTHYDWAIKLGSGNHLRLYKRFGRTIPTGKIKIEIKMSVQGNPYVAIV